MKSIFAMSWVALSCGCVGCQSESGGSSGSQSTLGPSNDAGSPAPTTSEPAPSASGTTTSGATTAVADAAAPESSSAAVTAPGVCCDTSEPAGCADVRSCVCNDWQQQDCCSQWSTFCEVTAEQKCGAAPGCADLPATSSTSGDGGADKGACCTAHDTPGCADPSIEQCICGLLPDCCTLKWDATCVQLVNEKHCESGVRTCVCDTWQQGTCCTTEWTSFCQTVAEEKCMALPGCG